MDKPFTGAVTYLPNDEAFFADLHDANALGDDQWVSEYADRDLFVKALWDEIEVKGLLFPAGGKLDQLHLRVPKIAQDLDETQINDFTTLLYDLGPKFASVYRGFLRSTIASMFSAPIYFQRIPTIRVHFPNQEGFGTRQSWHSDIMLGHPPGEVNVWLPLTDAIDGNTMDILHRADSLPLMDMVGGDFTQFGSAFDHACKTVARPVVMEQGKYLMFDPRCIHATQHNKTNKTRVSMDFRVIPVPALAALRRSYTGGGRRPQPFAPGGYYAEQTI